MADLDMVFDDVAVVTDVDEGHVIAYGPRSVFAFDSTDVRLGGVYVGNDGARMFIAFAASAVAVDGDMGMPAVAALLFDDVSLVTDGGPPHFRGRMGMKFSDVEVVVGFSEMGVPDFGDNPPIGAAVTLRGNYLLYPPAGS